MNEFQLILKLLKYQHKHGILTRRTIMMIRILTTSIFLLSLSTATFASDVHKDSLSHGEQVQQDFQMLDQDKNGLLTKSELHAHPELAGTFREIDLNENNDVDMDEFLIYLSEATAAGKQEKSSDNDMMK